VQVALSFINECVHFPQNEYHVWVGPGLKKIIDPANFPPNFHFYHFNFGEVSIYKIRNIQKTLRQFEIKIKPQILISTTGPSYYHSIAPQILGFNLPLYIYPENETTQDRKPNFSPEFITALKSKLGYIPTAENIFYYIYAVFHSPQYRQRYSQFLKIDFPRLPLTSNNELFNQLVIKGEKLVNLHLMKNLPPTPMTKSETSTTANLPLFNGEERGAIHYQGDGKNEINQVKYNTNKQQILINQNCYFSGVSPIVWEFKIGGYQVLDKWLKDRKSANIDLSDAEITHYQQIIIVVIETIKLMTEIDDIIPHFPII
jgi:predicted helicase